MPRTQYASTVSIPPPTVEAISGNLPPGSYTFWLGCRCRGGYSQPSDPQTLILESEGGIQITIPASIRQPISELHKILIVMAIGSTDIANGSLVAAVEGWELDGETLTPLPAAVSFFEPNHTRQFPQVNSLLDLPISPLNGARYYVEEQEQFLDWSDRLDSWVAISNPAEGFLPLVSRSTAEGGSDRDIGEIAPGTTIVSTYELGANAETSGTSEAVTYWLVNDTSSDLPKGLRILKSITLNGYPASTQFAGLMEVALGGYGNLTDGTLDASEMSVDEFVPYQGDIATDLALPKPLPPNYACILRIRARFGGAELAGQVPQGAVLSIYPRFAPSFSKFTELGAIVGNVILPDRDRRRIVPNGAGPTALALEGRGIIASYSWGVTPLGTQEIFAIPVDRERVNIAISNTGTCYASPSVPAATADLRAVLGTNRGEGIRSDWSEPVSLSPGVLLQFEMSYPQVVRSNYPDVIAGTSAECNATKIRVYFQSSTGTLSFIDAPASPDPEINPDGETFLLGSTAPDPVTVLPAIGENFGCFLAPKVSPVAVAGASEFESETYRVSIAFLYENTVTTISHNPAVGCVPELEKPLIDLVRDMDEISAGGNLQQNILAQKFYG